MMQIRLKNENARGTHSRRPSPWWLYCLLLALLAAHGVSVAGQAARAIVYGFSPSQGAQGTTVSMTFSGVNLAGRTLNLNFVPSAGMTVISAMAVSPKQIQAQVRIDANAQAGPRQVRLLVGDISANVASPFTVTAQKSACGTLAACGTPPPPTTQPMEVGNLAPLKGTQGQTVTLTLTGQNFNKYAKLRFSPADGINILSTTMVSATELQAQVSLAPNAPLGPRIVMVGVDNNWKTRAPNTFTVVSSAALTTTIAPMILSVTPNSIAPGARFVDVTLMGNNFVPGMNVTFPSRAGTLPDVMANGPVLYVNSNEVHVLISAQPMALPGTRDVDLYNGPEGANGTTTPSTLFVGANGLAPRLLFTGLQMFSVKQPQSTIAPTTIKFSQIPLTLPTEGVIDLDDPMWGKIELWEGDWQNVMPLLDDDTVFQWNEQNPGLADYFMLRVYTKDGKTLLATKKIEPPPPVGGLYSAPPTYYRPDPQFLESVLQSVPTSSFANLVLHVKGQLAGKAMGSLQATSQSSGGTSQPSGGSSGGASSSDQGLQLSDGDLQWEVAGYHIYNKNGIVNKPQQLRVAMVTQSAILNNNASTQGAGAQNSGDTTDLEVEISPRWPLGKPLAPTGMACTAGTGSGLQVQNVADKNVYDANGKPTGAIDQNDYVGDPFVLSGNFDLSRSPYAAHPKLVQSPCTGSPCIATTIAAVRFDNVFVDWGDGTIEAVTAPPNDPNAYNYGRGVQLTLPIDPNSPYRVAHTYNSPGSFIVRVFQLPESDAQSTDMQQLSASVDGAGSSPFLQAAAVKMASLNGGQAAMQHSLMAVTSGTSSSSGGSGMAQVAQDAFMLYCNTFNPTVPDDLVADGPLHLNSIDDPNFPGYDVMRKRFVTLSDGAGANSGGLAGRKLEQLQSSKPETTLLNTPSKIQLQSGEPGNPPAFLGVAAVKPVAICSTCDDGIMAQSRIHYYGSGYVNVTWTIDGSQSQEIMGLGPSKKRMNLKRHYALGEAQPTIKVSVSDPVNSEALAVKPVGMHGVQVEADVAPAPSNPNLSLTAGEVLKSLSALGTGNNPKGVASDALASARQFLNTVAPPQGSSLPALKVGVLSPSNLSTQGLGAVQYLNDAVERVANSLSPSPAQSGGQQYGKLILRLPGQHVASGTKDYEVVASDPTKPCKFHFPVKSGGSFEISGLQNSVTKNGTRYNGTGKLIIQLVNSTGGYDAYPPVEVRIKDWNVPDGDTVQSGSIDVSPKIPLAESIPGLAGTIDRLQGTAGGELDATLSVTLRDTTLRLPGEHPVAWAGVTSELKSSGDWIKDGLTLPTTLIGWSAFTMQSSTVRIDLSHNDGDAAGPLCGWLHGGDWVGVRFPSLTITPYTMDLVSSSAFQPVVRDWGITAGGLCGSLSTGPFSAKLGGGSVGFDTLNASISNGSFQATYHNMDVHVPWLDADLRGDATLVSGGGKQASISFPFSSQPITKQLGAVTLKASNLVFTSLQGIGWGLQTSSHFTFFTDSGKFTEFDYPLIYDMDGYGYFANNATAADIPLGGSTRFAATPVDLISVHMALPHTGPEVLSALFSTTSHLSETMPAAPMQINFEVDNNGGNYTSPKPTHSAIDLDVPYPSGQPTSEAHVHPQYSGGPNYEFSGSVDLAELGGPPVKGEFRLGYENSHDYWLARVTVGLGAEGIPIISVPPIMNLYRVQGGLGHNFPIDAFQSDSSLASAQPVNDNSFLFDAGIRLGSPDTFTYTVDGDLTIEATGQDAGARLNFHAWLLKQPSGNGDFNGYLQYAGSSFDARMWGHLNFLDGAASLDMGSGPNDAAIDVHFGSGPWHIDAGKKDGPRITGQFLMYSADSYMMLSDQGLSIGAGEHVHLGVGDDSSISAWVDGKMDMDLTITPQPHISGDFSASVSAGVCALGACVSAGVSAQVHAEAMPVEIDASASIGLPWPLPSVSFSVHL